MKYLLKPEYALRSYSSLRKAIIKKQSETVIALKQKQWDFLMRCDGKQEIEKSEELQKWITRESLFFYYDEIEEEGELSPWQKDIVHDNVFFPSVEWRITDRCNYNCLHCYNAADESANADIWEYEDALNFLDQAKQCGINRIILSGGEPMMHKHFLDIYKAVYERDMYVSEIVTNGYYLTQEILDEIAAFGKKPLFKVSFDGFGYHDWMRDFKGAEKRAIDAFELLHKNEFPILVNAQINRRNKDSFEKTMDYFDKLGIQTLRFIRTTEVPRWVLKAGDASMTEEEYYDTMVEILKKYNEKERTMGLILWEFAAVNPKEKTFNMIHTRCPVGAYRPTMPACGVMRKQICVGASGKIYPCSQVSGIMDSRNLSFGNVKTDRLQPLLQKGPYVDIATMTVAQIEENNQECAHCEHFQQCTSGCPSLGYLKTGSFYGKNESMCHMYELDCESKVQAALPEWHNASVSPGHTTIEKEEC